MDNYHISAEIKIRFMSGIISNCGYDIMILRYYIAILFIK